MNTFTDAELDYLASQPLMRFASASPSGKPDVAPVVFSVDGGDILTAGFDITHTVRYKNVLANPRATLVIDDLASTNPWSPRGIKIIGAAGVEEGDGGPRFRISPEVIISWGINDDSPGIPTMQRRVVGARGGIVPLDQSPRVERDMNKYMVVCTFAVDVDWDDVTAIVPAEQAAAKALEEEGRLSAVRVSVKRDKVFLEVSAPDEKDALATTRRLPMSQWWDFEIFQIATPV